MLNVNTHIHQSIILRLFILYVVSLIVGAIFILEIQTFYWYSFLILISSVFVIGFNYYIIRRESASIFLLILFFFTLLYGVTLIYLSSATLINHFGKPFFALDDENYHYQQVEIFNKLKIHKGELSPRTLDSGFYSGYPNIGGITMYIFGSNSYNIPRFLTLFLHAIGIFPFYRTIRSYASETSSKFSVILYAVSPMLFINSIFQLKDTIIIFIVLICISLMNNILKKKRKLKPILMISLCLSLLISIRAMIILMFLLSIIIFALVSKSERNKLLLRAPIMVFIIALVTIVFWKYLSNFNLFLTPDDYFRLRLEMLGESDNLMGTKSNISSTHFAAIVSAPLYVVLSPFLPIPDSILFENPLYPSTNAYFASNLYYYAILPLVFLGAYYIFKNRKTFPLPLFILTLFIVYKIGSALSGMTAFSYRQSLPTILCALMIVPIGIDHMNTISAKRIMKVVFLISIVTMCAWSIFRLYIRQ